jgi:redox-sensitive bicupin YhaK (pirin superfamily)
MKQFGVFDKGAYRRNEGVSGKKNMDSFQATWEYANKREMVYPKPQYADPILINPAHFRWMTLAGANGVETKKLGTFTDCEIRCARYRVAAGSSFTGMGRGLFLVLSGKGSIGGEPMRRFTAAYLGDGEQATFQADETTEIQLLGLPSESQIGQQPQSSDESAAVV